MMACPRRPSPESTPGRRASSPRTKGTATVQGRAVRRSCLSSRSHSPLASVRRLRVVRLKEALFPALAFAGGGQRSTNRDRANSRSNNELQDGEIRWRHPAIHKSTENATKLTPEATSFSGRDRPSRALRFSNHVLFRHLGALTCGVTLPETTNGGTGRRLSFNSSALDRDGEIRTRDPLNPILERGSGFLATDPAFIGEMSASTPYPASRCRRFPASDHDKNRDSAAAPAG